MTIGYIVYGQDNDSWMLEDGKPPNELRCTNCGLLTNFNYFNPFIKIRKKTYDFSHPYDIGFIVSLKFKEFCLREKYNEVVFKELEKSPGFFKFEATNILQFDTVRTGTLLIKYCEVCKSFGEVIGPEPPYLKNQDTPLPDGFFRSDYFFGSNNSKNPLMIIGPQTYLKLKREKFKGLTFVPIQS